MTSLRQRMSEDMPVRNLAPNGQLADTLALYLLLIHETAGAAATLYEGTLLRRTKNETSAEKPRISRIGAGPKK